MRRLVFLNALPINALPARKMGLLIEPVDPVTLKCLCLSAESVASYIRHPATVKLLNEKLGLSLQPSSGLYKYEEGDVLAVITLKKPVRGQEVNELTLNDLDIRVVWVSE